jgi:hypothetical protein
MADITDTIQEATEHAGESRLHAIIAVFVAVTATFMAICNVKDGNIVQAMSQAQANGVDAWSYFQAKSTKQALAENTLEILKEQKHRAVRRLLKNTKTKLSAMKLKKTK